MMGRLPLSDGPRRMSLLEESTSTMIHNHDLKSSNLNPCILPRFFDQPIRLKSVSWTGLGILRCTDLTIVISKRGDAQVM